MDNKSGASTVQVILVPQFINCLKWYIAGYWIKLNAIVFSLCKKSLDLASYPYKEF